MENVEIFVEDVKPESKTYNGEVWWSVRCKGKTYKLYVPGKPVIGSYYLCNVTETQGTWNGKPVVFRDARPIPKASTEQLPAIDTPLPQPIPKPTVDECIDIAIRCAQALSDWVDKSPRGPEAVAMVIQSIILGRRQNEVITAAPADLPDAESLRW